MCAASSTSLSVSSKDNEIKASDALAENVIAALTGLNKALEADNKILIDNKIEDSDLARLEKRKLTLTELEMAIKQVSLLPRSIPLREVLTKQKKEAKSQDSDSILFLPIRVCSDPDVYQCKIEKFAEGITQVVLTPEEAWPSVGFFDIPLQGDRKGRFRRGWKTFLHMAIEFGNLEAVRLLLQAKANPNIISSYLEPLLLEKAYRGGDWSDYKVSYISPLMMSCDNYLSPAIYWGRLNNEYSETNRLRLNERSYQIIKALIANGANVHWRRENCPTLLTKHIFNLLYNDSNGLELFRLLIQSGASLSFSDGNGNTPLLLAAQEAPLKLAILLREYLAIQSQSTKRLSTNFGIITAKEESALDLALNHFFQNELSEDAVNITLDTISLLLTLHPYFLVNQSLLYFPPEFDERLIKIYRILAAANPSERSSIQCIRKLQEICPDRPDRKYAHNKKESTLVTKVIYEQKQTESKNLSTSEASEYNIIEALAHLYRALEADNSVLTTTGIKESTDHTACVERRKFTLFELEMAIERVSNLSLSNLSTILKTGGKSAGKNSITFLPINILKKSEIKDDTLDPFENGITEVTLSAEEASPSLNYIDMPVKGEIRGGSRGWKTFLHLAIESENLEAIQLLIQAKANPNIILSYLDYCYDTDIRGSWRHHCKVRVLNSTSIIHKALATSSPSSTVSVSDSKEVKESIHESAKKSEVVITSETHAITNSPLPSRPERNTSHSFSSP